MLAEFTNHLNLRNPGSDNKELCFPQLLDTPMLNRKLKPQKTGLKKKVLSKMSPEFARNLSPEFPEFIAI